MELFEGLENWQVKDEDKVKIPIRGTPKTLEDAVEHFLEAIGVNTEKKNIEIGYAIIRDFMAQKMMHAYREDEKLAAMVWEKLSKRK